MGSRRTVALLAVCALVLAGAAAMVLRGSATGPSASAQFGAPGIEPMSFDQARGEFYRLAPALLLVVYDAFGQTQEDEIYDTLASVADGDALEELYLERAGAMKGGGVEEADQTIHEIKLLASTATSADNTLVIDASWQVIGTVGHAEHLHVRGNTYSADLTVAPMGDAWKITAFELTEVNREAAGETFLAP
ncbi:MAG: hypothetical protein AAFN59_09160, partial [Pseudomonadota bacterium]